VFDGVLVTIGVLVRVGVVTRMKEASVKVRVVLEYW